MDGLSQVAAEAAQAGQKIGPGGANADHVAEFEQLMRDAGGFGQGMDRYVNGSQSPSQWLSDTVIKAGDEISKNYRNGVVQMSQKLEQLDPTDPMMLPRLVQLQMEMHNAAFQLQFTTSLVHLANTGVKTLFQLQG